MAVGKKEEVQEHMKLKRADLSAELETLALDIKFLQSHQRTMISHIEQDVNAYHYYSVNSQNMAVYIHPVI